MATVDDRDRAIGGGRPRRRVLCPVTTRRKTSSAGAGPGWASGRTLHWRWMTGEEADWTRRLPGHRRNPDHHSLERTDSTIWMANWESCGKLIHSGARGTGGAGGGGESVGKRRGVLDGERFRSGSLFGNTDK